MDKLRITLGGREFEIAPRLLGRMAEALRFALANSEEIRGCEHSAELREAAELFGSLSRSRAAGERPPEGPSALSVERGGGLAGVIRLLDEAGVPYYSPEPVASFGTDFVVLKGQLPEQVITRLQALRGVHALDGELHELPGPPFGR
jgi:hypothetical protein